MLLFLLNLKISVNFFIQNIAGSAAFSLVLFLCSVLLSQEIQKFIKLNNPSTLVLSEHPDLLEREKEFIKSIFAGEKFDYIASVYNISPGTVRNKMREVYKKLGVADKTELLIRYKNYTE